jgi:hypothetical protein
MASISRIRYPSKAASAAATEPGEVPADVDVPGALYLSFIPSQSFDLQESTSTAAGFTATLASTDTTASWLAHVVNSSKVTVKGSQKENKATLSELECDLIYPSAASPTPFKLTLSTAHEALQQQFGPWTDPVTGLDVFSHEGGLLLAVKAPSVSQGITFDSLLGLCEIKVSSWVSKILSKIPLCLRTLPSDADKNATPWSYPRNGLWVFAGHRKALLRLEFVLDLGGKAESFAEPLLKILPAHKSTELIFTTKKTASFIEKSSKPIMESELCISTSIQFTVTDSTPKGFDGQNLNVCVDLLPDTTTFTIQNVSRTPFEDLLELFGSHLETVVGGQKGVKQVFGNLHTRLKQQMANTETTSQDHPSVEIHWQDISVVVSGEKLAQISLTLELDTPFGVPSGKQSVFLFTFLWSVTENDFSLNGHFWPAKAPTEPLEPSMQLEITLNSMYESRMLLQRVSKNISSKLSLWQLHPALAIDNPPDWIPSDIVELDIILSRTSITFEATLQTREGSHQFLIPQLSFENLALSFFFQYTFGQKSSIAFSVRASLTLSPSKIITANVSPVALEAEVIYQRARWSLKATARNLTSAHLCSLLPENIRDDISRMIPAIRIPGLRVQYRTGGTGPNLLDISGHFVIGGLLLTFSYHHSSNSDWFLRASLDSKTTQAASTTTTIGTLMHGIFGDEVEHFMPDFILNVEVPLEELVDDGISLYITHSSDGLVFGFAVRLESLHLDLAQVSGTRLSSPSSQSQTSSTPPRRLLRLSINQFPHVPDIPIVGELPQPFDQISFVWASADTTKQDVDCLNQLVYSQEGNNLQVKESQGLKLEDVVLKQGLHFLVSMNVDGVPKVILDYLFGEAAHPQSSETSTVVAKTQTSPDYNPPAESHSATASSAPAKDTQVAAEPGPQSEMAPIKKKSSSLAISNMGLQMTGKILTVHLNAVARLGPIELVLTGFALHFDLSTAKLPHLEGVKVSFSLDGLGVSYNRSPVSISGLFLHKASESNKTKVNTYAGGVVIGISSYTFAAVGAYSEITPPPPKEAFTSFFIFGALTGPLMHFEFAELRGISGGLGYNSFVKLPAVSEVPQFPFLTLGDTDNSDPLKTLSRFTELGTVNSQPEAMWIAAGLKLRAFELIDINAVLSLQLTQGEPVITLLGSATATVPQNATPSEAFALIEFGLKATLDLSHGQLCIEGDITPRSFLLSSKCHPTGGFALCSWSKESGHEGDMVFTVGGFHPAFARPAHYPNPARIGISWVYDSHLSIKGEAYYAITPAACMAGCSLNAIFQTDIISAHLSAHADFLVNFHPFHYEVSVGVQAGVTAQIKKWGISVKHSFELSATLDIHGPPMAGIAHFSVWIIKFTVAFGESKAPTKPLTLAAFWDTLAQGSPGTSSHVMAVESGLVPPTTSAGPPTGNTQSSPEKNDGSSTISQVRGGSVVFGVYSRTPISTATYHGQNALKSSQPIYSRAMQLKSETIQSTIDFTIDHDTIIPFQMEPITKKLPASMWGKCEC